MNLPQVRQGGYRMATQLKLEPEIGIVWILEVGEGAGNGRDGLAMDREFGSNEMRDDKGVMGQRWGEVLTCRPKASNGQQFPCPA